ncbi:ATP-binding protein [Herbidospora sp. RD11066]
MIVGEWYALSSLQQFNTVHTLDDVWHSAKYHVGDMAPSPTAALRAGLKAAEQSPDSSPVGVVLQGAHGTGKTHMLSWLREETQTSGGYFFLISLLDSANFWESVVVSVLDGLTREGANGESQLKIFLRRLALQIGIPRLTRLAVIGNKELTPEDLNAFVATLRQVHKKVGGDARDTVRALALYASDKLDLQDVGQSFLSSIEHIAPEARSRWGIQAPNRSPQQIVRDISRLLALTGPSVMAVDQIDMLLVQAPEAGRVDSNVDSRAKVAAIQAAHGLMELRETTRRTVTVVSCLPDTWLTIRTIAVETVQDRFAESIVLKRIPSAEVGRKLVEIRTAEHFSDIGFQPPYPTWPIKAEAFEVAPLMTPRRLLKRVYNHIAACVARGEVSELDRLDGTIEEHVPVITPPIVDLVAIDTRFAMLADSVEVGRALDPAAEDEVFPEILAAGLKAWIAEQGSGDRVYSVDAEPSRKPPLHARLRLSLNEATEDEVHWAFRAIAAPHHIAALTRIRNAAVAAGLDAGVPKRRLILIRRTEWNKGKVTQEALSDFRAAGGRDIGIDDEDLRVMHALRDLIKEAPPGLESWFAARKPATNTRFFKEALGDWPDLTLPAPAPSVDTLEEQGPQTPKGPVGDVLEDPPAQAEPLPTRKSGTSGHGPQNHPVGVPSLIVGRSYERGLPVSVELEALRKHVAIFAGSGSGKTVLIRRIIEECAIQGVSSIVLDTNNDLARLGDAWPEEPSGWGPGDAARAARYIADTEVVVWTPRREKGRPLAFQPLPDFTSVRDDVDEFNEAVDAAVAALVPRAKIEGNTGKAEMARAVLKAAVVHFGKYKSGGLNGLINLLEDFPEDISQISEAVKIAHGLSQVLHAAKVNDPLFGGEGQPVDPGLLLTPAPGKRARVSVISFVGLQSNAERQSFVNQLQMGLFAWIKKNPAGDRPLGGLFVMDEAQNFAPSGATTVCTKSTLALASQARKYGLGLVFATQAPKGLHNQIPGNAATQFYGLLNAQVQIDAAKEMARAKGGSADDISSLVTGQFYVAPEGAGFAKVRTPLCLSHHPRAPLTTEEVIERASR